MRAKRKSLVALSLVSALVSAPVLQAGFLKDVDKAMHDYADNIQKQGDDNLATMKTIVDAAKAGKLKDILPAVDAGMKTYGADIQTTGDVAWADLKPILKDLVDPKTYLPAPLKKAWEAFVAELAVLKARFLRRCEHPWADDPPAGGGNPPPAPPAPPAPPTPPTTRSVSFTDPGVPAIRSAPPTGSSTSPTRVTTSRGSSRATSWTTATGARPAFFSDVRPSAIVTADPPVGVAGMQECYGEYLGVRLDTLAANDWSHSQLKSDQQGPVGEKIELMAGHAKDMEERLFAKLSANRTAVRALASYIEGLDAKAKAQFASLVDRLHKSWNMAALQDQADATKAEIARTLARLKSTLGR